MFPNLDVVGWYQTGPKQTNDFPDEKADMQLQKAVLNQCESPIYMIMNPNSKEAKDRKQIPIFLYETKTSGLTKHFVPVNFALA